MDERESEALRAFLATRGRQMSSEILLTESARAVQRRAAVRGEEQGPLLSRLAELVGGLYLRLLDRQLLMRAGRLPPAALRTLDAIHLATALSAPRVPDSFVSYDRRQLEAARSVGLPTASPGGKVG